MQRLSTRKGERGERAGDSWRQQAALSSVGFPFSLWQREKASDLAEPVVFVPWGPSH